MKLPETYGPILKDLADTMLGVARESVALMKRSDQKHSLKLNRTQEWGVYLEFLRVQFNLIDRLSAFHIPIQDQPEFMNSLEDSVSMQLRTNLAPTMSVAEIDEMEVTLAIGKTVSESRQIYERHKFVVTEESKERDAFFQAFAVRVTGKMEASGSEGLTSAALLCVSSVVPALSKLFEDATASSSQPKNQESVGPEASEPSDPSSTAPQDESGPTQTITLVRVMSKVSGEEIDSWWGIHPQFQRDLQPQEAKELTQHMNRVTRILGERFAVVASLAQSSGDQPVGHA